jgi:serine/threonine-protein kinase
VQIARQLCAGLAAAHEQGVLHRDLKPANVMIDGRGRAKITDFGLAVLAEGAERRADGAGTRLYMAPERLAGQPASIRSDVYALGLVLYELFTGRRPFTAETAQELARLQRETTPTSPSAHVEGFDPAVERVILRCLRSDAKERPGSALAVAAALPGGDPLAAALAAGETPSPELVADAGEEGGISAGTGWASAVALVAGVALVLALSSRTHLSRLVPLDKPPDALTERARTILGDLGYVDDPVDSASGFIGDLRYLDSIMERDRSSGRWSQLAAGRPPGIRFWYRESPRALFTPFRIVPYPADSDPPTNEPGMITLHLDTRGRLEQLVVVPPERDEGTVVAAEPDWSPLLAAGGLDAASLRRVKSQWVPPVGADCRAAWESVSSGAIETQIHVEAAGYGGRTVWFRILYPSTEPASRGAAAQTDLRRLSASMGGSLVLSIIVAGIVIARRNLRLGRGDSRGAKRIALIVFLLGYASSLLAGHYVGSPEMAREVLLFGGFPLMIAASTWVFYLALEPYLRRMWPQLLVSWVRLLDGRVRDPLVARDALVGLLVGVGSYLLAQTYQLGSERLGLAAPVIDTVAGPPIDTTLFALTGARQACSNLVAFVVAGILFTLGPLVLLLLLRIATRRQWIAIVAFVVMMSVVGIPNGVDPRGWIVMAALDNALTLFALFRFGIVTAAVGSLVALLLRCYPMTVDPSAWYVGGTLIVLAVIGAIATYGLRFSVVGPRAAPSQ